MIREEEGGFVGGQRAAEEIALAGGAAEAAEEFQVFLAFDAFGDGMEAEGIGDAHDGLEEAGVRLGAAEEGLVDLQGFKREAAEVLEGGVAGAEIVEFEAHAQLLDGFEFLPGDVDLFDHGGFGDFQAQAGGGEMVGV